MPSPRSNSEPDIAEVLAPRYDELNKLFTAAEARIKSYKPVLATWITGQNFHPNLLGFQKFNGAWRIVIAEDENPHDQEISAGPMKPAVECPIEVRVVAANLVRALNDRLAAMRRETVGKVEAAIEELQAFCTEETDPFGTRKATDANGEEIPF